MVILGHFLPRKPKFWKKEKSTWRCYYFKPKQQKTRSNDVWLNDVWLLRYVVWQTIFCHFRSIFALLPQYWTWKSKFGKNVKDTRWYYLLTHVHQKLASYDVWFQRYKVTFDPPNNPKNQNFEKIKKRLEISFYTCVREMTIIWCMVPEISKQDRQNFLSFWASFFPLTPLTTQKIKILKKRKKILELLSFYTWVP